jgi:bacteriorhodopsin
MAENKTTLEPRWLWYAISFILPVVGILLGIIYRRKELPESKEFGKRTTIAAIVGVVACLTFYVVWLFVLGAAEWMK